jgi:nicotinate phosphoribosyltransferase
MSEPCRHGPSALRTDLYQLTMAYGAWRLGRHDTRAVFHLFFRTPPFEGTHALVAGTEPAVDFVATARFSDGDLAWLGTLTGSDGRPLFSSEFLEFLRSAPPGFGLDVDGMPEGTPALAREPLLRVSGPLWACQLVETALLNLVNFQTLIATKATRVVSAAGGGAVLELGMRRAQGPDGALSATRAAWIGGIAGTSNVLAGRRWQIPVRGTLAHSWVMSFADEEEAFSAYGEAMPNNALFLVDTYDTPTGVDRAIVVGERLRAAGFKLLGVRLDSGDLASLAKDARARLDAAGFPSASIVASNDLDEHAIMALRAAGAPIDTWGVGTRLVTGHDQPALGGVYKLGAIEQDGAWRYALKLSGDPIKVSDPGVLAVRRVFQDGEAVHDLLYDVDLPPSEEGEDLLIPLLRNGQRVGETDVHEARARAARWLDRLPKAMLRLEAPDALPLRIEPRLAARRAAMIAQHSGGGGS